MAALADSGRPRDLPLALSLAAAALVAVGWRGGYTEAGRGLTIVLASLALAVALQRHPEAVLRSARSPVPLLLGGLAAVGALSAAWTVGPTDDALRWAAVLLALGAIAVAAASLPGPGTHAAILLVVGGVSASVGLVGAIGHVDRIGLDICGSWRPAGPLEYPNALALVCVSALPCAVAGMATSRGWRSGGFAAVGWLLAATVAVSGSRLLVALAVAALVAAAVFLPHAARAAAPAAAAAVLAIAAIGVALVVGGELGDDGAVSLVAAGLSGVLIAVAWPVLADRSGDAGRAAWLVALCVAGVVGVAGASAAERVGGCAYSGLAHGRSGIWSAAVDTAREKPLAGHGLESFAVASRSEQLQERPRPVQYAHALPLEAWVELGVLGVLLVLALFAAVILTALGASRATAAVLGPAALVFLAANLFDWQWHLAGCAVVWAIAVGGLLAGRTDPT